MKDAATDIQIKQWPEGYTKPVLIRGIDAKDNEQFGVLVKPHESGDVAKATKINVFRLSADGKSTEVEQNMSFGDALTTIDLLAQSCALPKKEPWFREYAAGIMVSTLMVAVLVHTIWFVRQRALGGGK